MADIFVEVVQRLWDLGVLKYLLPYMLSSAIFYGLLRKSQVFGKPDENAAVNSVVAMVAAFMMFSYPIVAGIDIGEHLVYFFTQGTVVILVFMMALMIAGMFLPPDLPDYLSKNLLKGNKSAAVILLGILFAFIVVLSSGLWTVVLGPELVNMSNDILITALVILLLIAPFMYMFWPTGNNDQNKGGNN
jgi:Na+-driven multidrug efflux pump